MNTNILSTTSIIFSNVKTSNTKTLLKILDLLKKLCNPSILSNKFKHIKFTVTRQDAYNKTKIQARQFLIQISLEKNFKKCQPVDDNRPKCITLSSPGAIMSGASALAAKIARKKG